MSKAAAKTALGPMVMVAIEQLFPSNQRIIDDNFAYLILPKGMRAYVCLMRIKWIRDWAVRMIEKILPGMWGAMMYRQRYIDEKLSESVGQVDAVVNLGAGFDTRAYRLQAIADMPVWEVDQPENIEPKRIRLQKLLGKAPTNVTLVAIDFDREELGSMLASHNYSVNTKTFFIWEAVTQYLTESGIRATFDFLAKVAHGSRLVFTYVRKEFFTGQFMYGQEATYKKYVKNKVWHFCMDPEGVADFLIGYGWHVIEHLGYDELAERYKKLNGRKLSSTPIERIVYAEKV